jgi:hypothetical protein
MKMDWPDFPVISPDGRRVVLPGIANGGQDQRTSRDRVRDADSSAIVNLTSGIQIP